MRTELARMRKALRKALPEKAFLKRDRGSALFITNAPVFDLSINSIPGFILVPDGKLVQILPDAESISEIESRFPEAPESLSASLLRFRSIMPDMENLQLCAHGLKLIDMVPSAPAKEIEAFDRSLRSHAALALRDAACGGGLYASALINHSIKSIKENEI